MLNKKVGTDAYVLFICREILALETVYFKKSTYSLIIHVGLMINWLLFVTLLFMSSDT